MATAASPSSAATNVVDQTFAADESQPSSPHASEASQEHKQPSDDDAEGNTSLRKGLRFWLVYVSQCLTAFATALEATVTVTALPTITKSIQASDAQYVWIANSFLIASTAVQPMVAQLSNIFGRRWPLVICIALFTLGSGIAGGAINVGMLIAGRTVQGIGAGGSFVLVDVVTSDLVPQRERGPYMGVVFALAGVGVTLGPLVGGALADANWRWVYYIMLPIGGVALLAEFFFLRLKHKVEPTWGSALSRVDVLGSLIFIPSMVAIMVGVVLGGTSFPWTSYHIIVPLVLGFLGWICYHIFEASPFCKEPSTPPRLFTNRTSCAGFLIAFIAAMLLEWIFYFMPVYFQGSKGTTPFRSGVDILPLSILMLPSAIVSGIIMTKSGRFRAIHAVGCVFLTVGTGLLSILDASSSKEKWASFQVIASIGIGFTMSTVLPAIQSSLPEREVASTTGTYAFLRSFGMLWGVVIPSTIFNSQINSMLGQITNPNVRQSLANGQAYGFATAGTAATLPLQDRQEIQQVYSDALQRVWEAAIAFAGVCFLVCLVEKEIPLRKELDTEYGLDDSKKASRSNVESDATDIEEKAEK